MYLSIARCVYMVDPSSIMTASTRRARSSVPRARARSEATVSLLPTTPEVVTEKDQDDSDEDSTERLTMSPAEIRVIRRLSARANVLPVIARADSLTDDKLSAVKDAVRKDLQDAGLDFGLFGPAKAYVDETNQKLNGRMNGHANGHDELNGVEEDSDEEEEEEEERPSRPVIKLRPSRHSGRTSRSRSRRDLKSAAENETDSPRDVDRESIANVRFSAHIVSKTDLSTLLPFALIAPENSSKRKQQPKVRPVSTDSRVSTYSSAVEEPMEDAYRAPSVQPSIPPSVRNFAYLQGPPADLKGVFTRKFRWGTVDVLDPSHCDFAALRTAVLSTHLKVRLGTLIPYRCVLTTCLHRSLRLAPERSYTRSTGRRSFWRGVLHAASTKRKQNECWKVNAKSLLEVSLTHDCRYSPPDLELIHLNFNFYLLTGYVLCASFVLCSRSRLLPSCWKGLACDCLSLWGRVLTFLMSAYCRNLMRSKSRWMETLYLYL